MEYKLLKLQRKPEIQFGRVGRVKPELIPTGQWKTKGRGLPSGKHYGVFEKGFPAPEGAL